MNFLFNLILGVTFGLGLLFSKFFDPVTVVSFLSWTKNSDPSMLIAITGMVLTTLIFFTLCKRVKLVKVQKTSKPEQTNLNIEVIIGSILFGIGWSVSGLCVSTATINLVFGEWQTALFFLFMIGGFYCPRFLKSIML